MNLGFPLIDTILREFALDAGSPKTTKDTDVSPCEFIVIDVLTCTPLLVTLRLRYGRWLMKLTNVHNLPDSFVRFIRNEKYSRGDSDISVTSLIDSPRIEKLRAMHSDQMTMDVSERIPSLFGTAVHMVLQEIEDPRYVVEERLYASMHGWNFSGAIDVQEYMADGTVTIMDYKVCSTWAVMNDKPEWEKQLNCYAYLVRKNKERAVSKLQIVAILRDWSRRKAMTEKDYPKSQVIMVDVPLWEFEQQEAYLETRILMHKDSQVRFDFVNSIIACTSEERWAKPTRWAVMKKNRKTAVKLFDDPREAQIFIDSQKTANADFYIEERRGGYTRCEGNFCGVAEFCDQYKGDNQ